MLELSVMPVSCPVDTIVYKKIIAADQQELYAVSKRIRFLK